MDNGFDLGLGPQGDWLAYGSSHAPLRVWQTAYGETLLIVALSQANVLGALADHGTPITNPLPSGACGARGVTTYAELHRLLRRAFQLSRTLPDELLVAFNKATALLPRKTDAERLVVQRVGQDIYRGGLLEYWEGRCAISGLAVPELLRASHIKPWADCETDAERLDVFNGFLLAPNFDAAFDKGFITVTDDGLVVAAGALDEQTRAKLGLDEYYEVAGLTESHRHYLEWHRNRVFRG